MKYLPYGHSPNTSLILVVGRLLRQRIAGHLAPMCGRLFRLSRQPATRRIAGYLLLALGLVLQLVLTLVVMELIDLSISLMELWAELARKHLEITL